MKFPFFLLLILIVLFSACKKAVKDDQKVYALTLYENSVELLNKVRDSIDEAQDSTQVDSLYALMEKKMTEINFSVPPETDLKLSEQENDSIYKLLSGINNLRQKKLEEFSVKFLRDSVPDSETNNLK